MNGIEPRFRIRENFKLIPCHNPISGYRWHEHGPTTSYTVVGPYGPVSWHRTEKGALKALKALEESK